MAPDTQSQEQLLELTRDELNKLAAKAGVEAPDKLQNKAAVAEAIANATAVSSEEPKPEDDEAASAGDESQGSFDDTAPSGTLDTGGLTDAEAEQLRSDWLEKHGRSEEDEVAPEPEPDEEQVGEPNDTSNPSGESATVTYLGRPETIAHNDEGEPLEEDVYQGTDPWAENRPVNIAVGDSLVVSAEKAAQLDADFPGAFEIS